MYTCLNCSHETESAFKFCPVCGTEATIGAVSDPLLGRVLSGKYRVLEEVGSGAMGRVYRAEQVSLKKPIAIKVLHEDLTVNEETVRRFQGEGIAAGKFSHPAAIQIFDFDKDGDGHWFLAMEFVEGDSLKDFLTEKGALSADGAVNLITQVLDALAEAHAQGIVHRDLKPDNVMVVGSGSGELFVKVLDFGLSKLVDTQAGSSLMTQTGRILGTPRYMAPEQWQGSDVDHRIDIYAAGLMLYEMVTGESPVSGTSVHDAMVQSASDVVPSLLDPDLDIVVPAGLEEVVSKALAKDREERYQSAQEMIRDLDEINFATTVKRRRRGSSGARARSAEARSGEARSARKRAVRSGGQRALLIGGGIAVLAALGFLGVRLFGGDEGATYARISLKPEGERTEGEREYLDALAQARESLRERNLDAAMAAVERARRLPCADADAFFVRAQIYAGKRDYATALLDCEEAVRLDPTYAEAVAEAGWIQFQSGDASEAENQFARALKIDANSYSAILGQATLQVDRGVVKGAKATLAKIPDGARSALDQVRLGSLYLGLGDVDAAVAAFTRAKRDNAFDWRAHAGLGTALVQQSNGEQARPALAEAIRLNPAAENARLTMATLYAGDELWDEALAVIEPGLAHNPGSGRLHILKGTALHGRGDNAAAIEALQEGTAKAPRDDQAWILLGVLRQGAEEYEKAIEAYEMAQSINTARLQPFLNHGLCLIQLGRYQDALPLLQRATQVDDRSSFAWLSLGVLAMEYLGDNATALQAFQKHRETGGTDPRVERWITRLGGK